mmetsp:Transcript_14401/g.26538  ORF Transcript_14401/g.26538 Transcript_14401/m.26538 type:complete len:136 (+) Transcript_14401:54-461(+)
MRCDELIGEEWSGLTTMRKENLCSSQHSKKLKAMGLLNLANTLEKVDGVRVKLGEAQASKVNIAVYHTPPDDEEVLVALVTLTNTLKQPGRDAKFIVKSDTGAGVGSVALFPSASPRRIIINTVFSAEKTTGESG